MERGDGPAGANGGKTLVQPMENPTARHKWLLQEEPAAVARQFFAKRTREAMRTIAVSEASLRVGARETEQDLTGVNADAGKIVADAIGGVERDRVGFRHVRPL